MEANLPTERPRRRYTLYTALAAFGIMLAVYFLLRVWPFGEYSIVTGDLGGLYINYFSHLRRFFLGESGFAYGFDKGLGGGLLGLYAYYYASPFNLIYLLFPVRWFPVAASLVQLAKFVLACTFFHVFIATKFSMLSWRAIPLSLCYGFTAYGFAYAQNIMWHDVLLLLPLICLGIDRIAAGASPGLYAAALAAAIFANFYIAYMACIFAVIYFFYTMLLRTGEQKTAGWKLPLLRFGAGSLLGGGLCAALLAPALYNINQTKGDLLSYSFSWARNFRLGRFPERFVWGSFALSDEYGELPFVYCGLLVLLLVFCYFASSAVKAKEKLLSGSILLIFLISFWARGFDLIWHGLKEPVWFPMRYSFIFCFFMVLLAARALACKATGRREVLIGGGVLLAALLIMAAFPIAVSRSRILLSAAAVLFYAICLLLAGTAVGARRRSLIFGALTLAAALELGMNGYYISSQLDQYTLASHQQRVDLAGGTVKAIQSADPGDYRIAETHYFSLNDPMLLGYRGLSHFGSTQDSPAQSVLYNLGYRNYEGAGPYLSGGTAFSDAVLALKYLSSNAELAVSTHWQGSNITAPYTVYENEFALPMLFAIDGSGMTDTRHGVYEDDLFAFQNDMYREMGGVGTLFTEVPGVELLAANGEPAGPGAAVAPGCEYRITAQESDTHYAWFSAKTLLLPMYVDGQYQSVYFSPTNKGAICLGWLEAGQTVNIRWDNTEAFEVEDYRVVRMDDNALHTFIEQMHAGAGNFTVEDGLVSGSVFSEANRNTLYTSIPYDADWQALVNEQTVIPHRFMGGLLAVPLQPGENKVELRYRPSGTGLGLAITLGSILLAVALFVLRPLLIKLKPKQAVSTNSSAYSSDDLNMTAVVSQDAPDAKTEVK